MRRLVMSVVMAASAGFLWWERTHPPRKPYEQAVYKAPSYETIFTDEEIAGIRAAVIDPNPHIRWSAIELLFAIRDPQIPRIVDRVLAEEPEPLIRAKVMALYSGGEDVAKLGTLVRGLSDVDVIVRLASLKALGEIGDPSVSVWVINALKDTEPEVRVEALRTLGRFQDRRRDEFDALAKKLKKDYEAAIKRARQR